LSYTIDALPANFYKKEFAHKNLAGCKRGGFMKRGYKVLVLAVLTAVLSAVSLYSLDGMTLNGATGLYTIPTARIAWDQQADLGVDLGTTFDFHNKNPIAKIGFSLFKWVELTTAFDIQQDPKNNFDTIIGLKVRIPTPLALAFGGNVQLINQERFGEDPLFYPAGQLYAAATYDGQIFSMPSETTIAFGYTFQKDLNSNIDYGMGFNITLFPDVLSGILHWLVDFSNFSYSVDPRGVDAAYRGALNTGVRVDVGSVTGLSQLKLMVDIIASDIFDGGNRSFLLGIAAGYAFL
jgi:hypothetical protein